MKRELLELLKFLFGFLPWILFLILPTDGWEPLRRAVLISLALSILFSWKMLSKGFILQWATVFFFAFSAIALYFFEWIWLARHMGFIANAFLSGVIWFTVLIGKPFTLQYARVELPKELWNDENLIRGSRFIAIFWGALLLVPTAFSGFRLLNPTALPGDFYFYLSLACIISGSIYTSYYKRIKRHNRESK